MVDCRLHPARALILAAVLVWAPKAMGFSSYYTSGVGTNQACTNCHSSTTTTCNGCHAHGTHPTSAKTTINITALPNKGSYAPGETVSVTVNGGYRNGWVRVNLYDGNMVQLARSSCPGGVGGCTTSVFPATLTAPAPLTPGTYTWRASWYGNAYDTGFTSATCGGTVTPPCFRIDTGNNATGAVHGEEIVAVTSFTVRARPSDFDGNGKSDILWRNPTTPINVLWLMNGTSVASATQIPRLDSSWQVAGVGDFDGNGKSDILWRSSTTGSTVAWLMNGGSASSSAQVAVLDSSWQVAGIGDFNGDGRSDIIWRNETTGSTVMWLMNGTSVTSSAQIAVVDSGWQLPP